MKLCRRSAFLPLFLICCSTPAALASETRILTLRNISGIADETDIYLYPGTLPQYSVALIELGTWDNRDVYGGALKKFGNLAAGAVVSRDTSLMTNDGLSEASLASLWLAKAASNDDTNAVLPAPERPVDLFFALGIGSSSSLGFRLTGASYRNKMGTTDGPTSSVDRRAEQLDLGIGYSQGTSSRIDVAMNASVLGKLKRKVETAALTTEGSYERKGEVGLFFRWIGGGQQTKPFTSVALAQREPKVTADPGTEKKSGRFDETLANVEGGVVVTPVPGVLIAGAGGLTHVESEGPIITAGTGVGAGASKPAIPSILASEDEVSKKTDLLYASLATEAVISGGLGFLGGFQYRLWGEVKTKDDFSQGKPKTTESIEETPDSALWALGLLYKIEALRIDATLAKGFLHRGPHVISGDETENMLARISLTYQL